MIEFDNNQINALQFYLDKFDNDFVERSEIQKERKQRRKTIQELTASPKKIESLSKSEINLIESSLWAYQRRYKKQIGNENDISKIKKTLKYLLFGNDNIFDRAHNVNTDPQYKIKYFGESKISELIFQSNASPNITLVNERSKNLAQRMGLDLEHKNFSDKFKAYDEFIKKVLNVTGLKTLDDVDFLLYFIDNTKFENDPLPRLKELKLKIKEEFAFVEDDFKRTTGKREDAKYLTKRMREFCRVLKQNLQPDFSNWKSYTNSANKRPGKDGVVKYWSTAWTGFTSHAFKGRVQDSVQLQTSVHDDYLDSGIWVSSSAKKEIQKVRKLLSSNNEVFKQLLQKLPANYFIGVYIKNDSKKYIEFELSDYTDKKFDGLLELLNDRKSEIGIGTWWEPKDVISMKTEIITEISDVFSKLLPIFQFLTNEKIELTDILIDPVNPENEFSKYEKILDNKSQIIFYGPPGTGKTYIAGNFAEFVIRDNVGKKYGDEPTSGKKTDWQQYLTNKLTAISPDEYKVDNSHGEEYFSLISQNDEKRIRVFYGNKEKKDDSVEVGFKEASTEWIKKVSIDNRFFIVINLSNASYIVLPYRDLKKNAQFRGGQNWDETGETSMWFTLSTVTEKQASLNTNDAVSGKRYNWNQFLFNLGSIFISDIEYVTFHPSYSYEEFVEGIKARTKDKGLEYYYEDGIFKRICTKARNDSTNKYVLIIDELNRGNLSKIFGELITTMENDKRDNLSVNLAYSKTKFSIPQNVYLVGTMNTADRSLVQVDVALRRRFGFVEFPPKPQLLSKPVDGISLDHLLVNLNKLVVHHSGNREYMIGHSFFMKSGKQFTNLSEVKFVFETEIIPLLQDYFYEDYVVLKDVLGEDFVDVNNQRINSLSEAQFKAALQPILEYGKPKAPEESV